MSFLVHLIRPSLARVSVVQTPELTYLGSWRIQYRSTKLEHHSSRATSERSRGYHGQLMVNWSQSAMTAVPDVGAKDQMPEISVREAKQKEEGGIAVGLMRRIHMMTKMNDYHKDWAFFFSFFFFRLICLISIDFAVVEHSRAPGHGLFFFHLAGR